MGYLYIPASSLPNFSKAVISLWFRIPAATFTAMTLIPYPLAPEANGQSDGSNGAYYWPALYKTIPLIVFGSVETESYLSNRIQPSYIGVDCYLDGLNALACNLQTPVDGVFTSDFDDTVATTRPGCFYMCGYVNPFGDPGNNYVAPDVWCHVLISPDLGDCSAEYDYVACGGAPGTGGAGVTTPQYTSASTFTWSFNDVNKTGATMYPANGDRFSGNGLSAAQIIPNFLLQNGGYTGFHSDGAPEDPDVQGDHVSLSGPYIKGTTDPVGAPATVEFVSNIFKVELAEIQVYTGVSLDAGIEESRRAFIKSDGTPETNYSIPDALLGKSPEIRLHGSAGFQSGTNSGTIGNFTKVGAVTASSTSLDISPS